MLIHKVTYLAKVKWSRKYFTLSLTLARVYVMCEPQKTHTNPAGGAYLVGWMYLVLLWLAFTFSTM